MKILLYSEAMRLIRISGLGRAVFHQKRALELNGITVTTDVKRLCECDAVHINTLGIGSKRLAKKARRMNIPVVYHAHSTEEDFRNSFVGSNVFSGLFRKWICSCYSLGDVIITPTEYSKSLLAGYGITKPIYAVSNGIDTDFYKRDTEGRMRFRKRYGFAETDKVVMAVGLYFERKGILDFVRLAYAMPDHRFIWFGKTPLISVPPKIRKAVRTKLPNLIFAGYVQPDELIEAYSGADVYIFPTYEETEGITLLEALSCHAETIVRDIPVFGWLRRGKDCYKAGGLEEFRYIIKGITSRRLPSLTENGYNAAAERSLDKTGEKLAAIYRDICKNV